MGRKSELEAKFNAGEIDVLVGQIGAMGVSLNLQRGGNCIIVVEEDWSPAIMDQFYARLYRMGQEKHVHVDTLESETKIDDAIHKISNEKARQHRILNAGITNE
jgi:SNF2 family DNA or RNA helicase